MRYVVIEDQVNGATYRYSVDNSEDAIIMKVMCDELAKENSHPFELFSYEFVKLCLGPIAKAVEDGDEEAFGAQDTKSSVIAATLLSMRPDGSNPDGSLVTITWQRSSLAEGLQARMCLASHADPVALDESVGAVPEVLIMH